MSLHVSSSSEYFLSFSTQTWLFHGLKESGTYHDFSQEFLHSPQPLFLRLLPLSAFSAETFPPQWLPASISFSFIRLFYPLPTISLPAHENSPLLFLQPGNVQAAFFSPPLDVCPAVPRTPTSRLLLPPSLLPPSHLTRALQSLSALKLSTSPPRVTSMNRQWKAVTPPRRNWKVKEREWSSDVLLLVKIARSLFSVGDN